MLKAWIYILKCSDGSFYTGSTTNLLKRFNEHNFGEGSNWTKNQLPIKLVFSQEMPDKNQAYVVEQQIKKWTRAKKQALINGQWDLLKYFSKKPKFRKGKLVTNSSSPPSTALRTLLRYAILYNKAKFKRNTNRYSGCS